MSSVVTSSQKFSNKWIKSSQSVYSHQNVAFKDHKCVSYHSNLFFVELILRIVTVAWLQLYKHCKSLQETWWKALESSGEPWKASRESYLNDIKLKKQQSMWEVWATNDLYYFSIRFNSINRNITSERTSFSTKSCLGDFWSVCEATETIKQETHVSGALFVSSGMWGGPCVCRRDIKLFKWGS